MTKSLSELVVLVPGLAQPRVAMWPLARYLRRRGFSTGVWTYPSIRLSIPRNAGALIRHVEGLQQSQQWKSIHIVAHSMGAILTRILLDQSPPPVSGRIVMLAPPNRGSRVARWFSVPLGCICPPLRELSDAPTSFVNGLPAREYPSVGVIAARADRVVSIESTRLPNAPHRVVPFGHTTMLFAPSVARCVESFLRRREFE